MRTCIQLQIDGLCLRGTSHEPPGASSEPGRTGVLFGNSAWLPRSGRGDLYAHLSDALAREGYWAFRIDMPGLGDSDGDLPAEPVDFLHMLQIGRYGPVFGSIAAELKKRYGLENVIMGGHCASATSAVYAALLDNGGVVSGLMLLELGFYTVPLSAVSIPAPGRPSSPLHNSFARARLAARRLVLNAPGRHVLRALYRRSLRVSQRLLKMELPVNSNTKLIEAWGRVMARKVPTLLIKAHHHAVRPAFDFEAYLKMAQQPCITAVAIEGTTHSLLEGNGGEAVQRHCGEWLREHFPARSLADNVQVI
jgi:pimeloyl-ACP methyl ester carboxylesterase